MKVTRSAANLLTSKESAFDVLATQEECPWSEHTDPDSKDTYYYNASTGETQWDEPAELRRHREQGASSKRLSTPRRMKKAEKSAAGPQSERARRLTAMLSSGGGAAPAAHGAASNWKESIDPSSGQKYWYNEVTGESSWDPVRPSVDLRPTRTVLVR